MAHQCPRSSKLASVNAVVMSPSFTHSLPYFWPFLFFSLVTHRNTQLVHFPERRFLFTISGCLAAPLASRDVGIKWLNAPLYLDSEYNLSFDDIPSSQHKTLSMIHPAIMTSLGFCPLESCPQNGNPHCLQGSADQLIPRPARRPKVTQSKEYSLPSLYAYHLAHPDPVPNLSVQWLAVPSH